MLELLLLPLNDQGQISNHYCTVSCQWRRTERLQVQDKSVKAVHLPVKEQTEKVRMGSWTWRAYMPTPKLHFQEQKSPKSGTQYNFQEHISKYIPTFMK